MISSSQSLSESVLESESLIFLTFYLQFSNLGMFPSEKLKTKGALDPLLNDAMQ